MRVNISKASVVIACDDLPFICAIKPTPQFSFRYLGGKDRVLLVGVIRALSLLCHNQKKSPNYNLKDICLVFEMRYLMSGLG
ncbi:hypothetical protein BSPWISOXPB_5338 [uncultured Gammaproteobacteria bacterium]|nr:hypothetical protein BSPWISOXPB_5338 [uncultured Gammaproteobacteria bacterium]